ncbi:MAG TPA: hypothetical protein VGQ86_04700 [Candidatus Limnocylindria bacterium]|nr:hypothetical protein [Candidatus Limnocylindria bacterium]
MPITNPGFEDGSTSPTGWLADGRPGYTLRRVTDSAYEGGASVAIGAPSTTATAASVEWRRFSDGGLVTTQTLTLTPASGVRIDPRAVAGLTDDTQYAVTVAATGGLVAAVVEEFASGGDNAMIYEGFSQ